MASRGTDVGAGKPPPVSIVGAGPAGLACAIALARAGYDVVVHEQRDRVGGRFHGDFQGLENWSCEGDVLAELTSSGILSSFDRTPVSRVDALMPGARVMRSRAPSRSITWCVGGGNQAHSTKRCWPRRRLSAWRFVFATV